jgi:hypothetical protein
MGYVIQSTRPDPTLEYDVTDAATGAPMRLTVYGGVIGVDNEKRGIRVYRAGEIDSGEAIGLYVPEMQPLPVGPDPVIVPEIFLTQAGVYLTDLHATRMHGVGGVQAQVAPDPQDPTRRWVYVSFRCFGNEPMVLRYRVTFYRPRP